MVFFYLLVLGTGVWAFFKSKRKQKKSEATGMEMALLGNRSLNWVVGIFTMTGEEKLFKWFFGPKKCHLGLSMSFIIIIIISFSDNSRICTALLTHFRKRNKSLLQKLQL